MTDRMSHRAPGQGKVRRAVAALGAFLNSLEYNSFDYTLERLELLEKEVGRLRRELGQGRHIDTVDALGASATGLEH